MHALLFEMEPRKGHEQHYFDHAANLRPLLKDHEGLLFIERFKSLSRPNIILSHSHWRDEASLSKWRSDRKHYKSQAAGRNRHFKDYRLRIAHALIFDGRDGEMHSWTSEGSYIDVTATPPRYLTIVSSLDDPSEIPGEVFKSVTVEGNFLSVADATSYAEAEAVVAAVV